MAGVVTEMSREVGTRGWKGLEIENDFCLTLVTVEDVGSRLVQLYQKCAFTKFVAHPL